VNRGSSATMSPSSVHWCVSMQVLCAYWRCSFSIDELLSTLIHACQLTFHRCCGTCDLTKAPLRKSFANVDLENEAVSFSLAFAFTSLKTWGCSAQLEQSNSWLLGSGTLQFLWSRALQELRPVMKEHPYHRPVRKTVKRTERCCLFEPCRDIGAPPT
jgi:hypothetical protein